MPGLTMNTTPLAAALRFIGNAALLACVWSVLAVAFLIIGG